MAKRALGKGLGALIDIQEETKSEQEEVHNAIPIYLIDINQKQPRKKFDEEKMQELADSIKQHGIIQPLVLKPENGRYLIIAGERRYRAARMAGLKQVPAVLKEVSEQELLQLSIIENIQREDLNSLEEAEGIADLMREFSLSQEKVAEILGRSRSAVANSLRLLNLPEKVKNDLVNGRLSAGHARSLLAIKDKQLQEKTAKYIIEKQMSVRETENYIKQLLSKKPKRETRAISAEFEAAEREIGEVLETKVRFKGNDRRGKIIIEYFSKEQLYAIYEYLRNQKE